MARDTIAPIIKIAYTAIEELTDDLKKDLEFVVPYLQKWHGEMHTDSIGASIYAYWQIEFFGSILAKFIPDWNTRITFNNNYPFIDFSQRMIEALKDDPTNAHFNQFCE